MTLLFSLLLSLSLSPSPVSHCFGLPSSLTTSEAVENSNCGLNSVKRRKPTYAAILGKNSSAAEHMCARAFCVYIASVKE